MRSVKLRAAGSFARPSDTRRTRSQVGRGSFSFSSYIKAMADGDSAGFLEARVLAYSLFFWRWLLCNGGGGEENMGWLRVDAFLELGEW